MDLIITPIIAGGHRIHLSALKTHLTYSAGQWPDTCWPTAASPAAGRPPPARTRPGTAEGSPCPARAPATTAPTGCHGLSVEGTGFC